jgi:hypothetical protein
MIYKFTVTLKQQLLLLIQPVCAYIFILTGLYLYSHELSFRTSEIAIIFIFLSDTLPALILHVQYLLKNSGTLLFIDEVNRTVTYENSNNKVEHITFNDIDSLEYYVSSVRNTGIYSFARYRFFKMILKNGNELIITCLMVNDIQNTLELLLHSKAEKKLKIICFI